MTGTALPSVLISPDWLAAHLDDPDLVVIDATVFPVNLRGGGSSWISADHDYRTRGHLPGAVYGDLTEDFVDLTSPRDLTPPSAAQFASATGRLGIDNISRVVIYDAGRGQWAARLWWLFRLYGHDQVAVLDGGLSNWIGDKRPLVTGAVTRIARTFEPREDLRWRAGRDDLSGQSQAILLAPAADDTAGDDSINRSQAIIPDDYVRFDLAATCDPLTKRLRPIKDVRAQVDTVLGGRSGRIIAASGSGVAAARIVFLLTLLGFADAALLQLAGNAD